MAPAPFVSLRGRRVEVDLKAQVCREGRAEPEMGMFRLVPVWCQRPTRAAHTLYTLAARGIYRMLPLLESHTTAQSLISDKVQHQFLRISESSVLIRKASS